MIEIMSIFYHTAEREFPKMLMSTWFESMFLPSNIPELMKFHKVVHNIYCAPPDLQYLKNYYLPMANKKGLDVSFNANIITSESSPRSQLHLAIKHQIKKSAENKSIIIFAAPDAVFGNGLANLVQGIKYDEYLVCPVLRISYENGFEAVNNFLKYGKPNNRRLTKFFIEIVPHKILELAKERDYDYMHLVKLRNGYVFYHKEPSPLMCYGNLDILSAFENPFFGEFEAIDHDVPNMFFKKGKLKYVSDNDRFVWGEFTMDNKYQEMIINHYWSDCAKYFCNQPLFWRTI